MRLFLEGYSGWLVSCCLKCRWKVAYLRYAATAVVISQNRNSGKRKSWARTRNLFVIPQWAPNKLQVNVTKRTITVQLWTLINWIKYRISDITKTSYYIYVYIYIYTHSKKQFIFVLKPILVKIFVLKF